MEEIILVSFRKMETNLHITHTIQKHFCKKEKLDKQPI